ncbi:hypothetical protein QE250_11835 [Chromatiaceae bacterium AAb-1]|nr:hypothetical protein [Chromatiaceae bacterium AAb-1]
MSVPLKKLLADLSSDAKLQQRFKQDPETVAAEYQLSEEETKALAENDHATLKQLLGEASENFVLILCSKR